MLINVLLWFVIESSVLTVLDPFAPYSPTQIDVSVKTFHDSHNTCV